MKKTKLLTCLIVLISGLWITLWAVPDYYKANYSISTDWENVKRIFVEIEANNQIWVQTSAESFATLYNSFSHIFPKFPQEYSFQITYQKCITLSQTLWNWSYDYDLFSSFMDNCFKPLSTILNTIDSSYTVKPNATVNPSNWPAPLTVTFNASTSIDPSSETIPENNYYWYYRDINWVDQVIWNKSVLSYTFEKAWNYIVHLTVRSSNNNNWIFDGEKDIAVNVRPMSAAISVYANWKKLNNLEKTKFGTQEWLNWIILDGSATIPIWERQIMQHSRKIEWWNWFSLKKEWENSPWIIKVYLPNEWEYKVTLTTKDNEWNSISETYSIVLADPVAIIKRSPEEWTTSTSFTFDASSSYSVTSSIKLYTWEIFDSNWNKKTTYQWKSIKYQFIEPGSYTIKLTVTDNNGEANTDTNILYVESTTPIAQFTFSPDSTRTYPSKYVLDASASSDIDMFNWVDDLYYSWTFSNPNTTTIQNIEWNNKKIKVSFDSLWEQKIKLTVTDRYWKTNDIEKSINIQSTLRPEITILPKAATWWTTINFIVKSNKDILNYSRSFWDGNTISTQTNKVSHKFNKVWIFKINLNVYWADWDANSITDNVFIWEKNAPIVWYSVKNKSNEIIRQKDVCIDSTNWNEYPAYKIIRYEDITIDPSDSVNTKWTKTDLKYFFQPKYWEIYNKTTFKNNFNELWCTYVDITVEDGAVWVSSKDRIWFKVYNNLPTLDNVILSFPQYWNEIWIWFNQSSAWNEFTSDGDLTVKVTAQNVKDTDGFISYFKWYYYYKDDPSRRIETKITPSSINYTYFELKEPWEYVFWVTIYDNDEWKTVSEDVLWNWPIVLLTQDSKNIDIPIVTLRINKSTVEVWDEVTFDVSSKIISDRSDFEQERTIRYDFDWDGERDLITKDDEVTYVYEKPNTDWYIPRVWVLYRWYEWTAKWWSIVVKDALKPRLLYTKAWNTVLFRDISLWEIEKSTICLSVIECKKNNAEYIIDSTKDSYFVFKYPKYQKYLLSIELQDEFANTINKNFDIEIQWIKTDNDKIVNYTWDIKLLTIPEGTEKGDWTIEIFVWNSLNNSVLFYALNENLTWECFVDLDITDNNPQDFNCNDKPFLQKYTPQYTSKIWRVYYEKDGTWMYKEFTVSFLDYSVELDEEKQKIYNKLWLLIKNTTDEDLKILLLNLQWWLLNDSETQANTIALHEYIENQKSSKKNETEVQEISWILDSLTDETVLSSIWWTEYDIAKAEILWILPRNLRTNVSILFNDFETAESNFENGTSQQDERKNILQNILQTIVNKTTDDLNNQKSDEISKSDLDEVVVPNICKIMDYYNIISNTNTCSNIDNVRVPDTDNIDKVEKLSKNKLWTGLKVLLISLSSLIGIFVLLVIFFAVKAKINRNKEEEEE